MSFRDLVESAVAGLRTFRQHAQESEPAWKSRLRRECAAWIDELEEPPEAAGHESGEPEPDLHTVLRELAALRTDAKKGAGHVRESTTRLQEEVRSLAGSVRSSLESAAASRAAGEQARDLLEKKKMLLPLVELYDRLVRVQKQLATVSVPRRLMFRRDRGRCETLKRIREGMALVCERYFRLLQSNGISRRETAGKPFDPLCMNGIERTVMVDAEAGTVLEEYSGAYLIGDHVLKSAEVRVAGSPEPLDGEQRKERGRGNGNDSRN